MANTFLKETSKTKNLTEKQQKFLDCLVETKGNAKEAAELAGYSGNHYQVVRALPEAAVRLVDIMRTDKPIPQITNKLQAAQTILDRVGVTKTERIEVDHKTNGGVFILPAKKEPPVNIIEAEDIEYAE